MGIERERRKGSGPHRALAGVRSFTLASLSGAAAALSGSVALLGAGAAFVAALGVVAYARDHSENPGVATEIALLLAYLIGVLCASDRLLAAALAVMVTGLTAWVALARIGRLQRGEHVALVQRIDQVGDHLGVGV